MLAANAMTTPAQTSALKPRFIVGQDHQGHWVVIEPHGLAGGIFVSRDAAFDYAEFECGHRPGAVQLAAEPIELKM